MSENINEILKTKTDSNKTTNPDESESYVCLECGADVSIDDKVCPKCGADVSKIEEKQEEFKEEHQFKTLLRLGEFISALGLILVVAAIIAIIAGLIAGLAGGEEGGYAIAGSSVLGIVSGIIMVVLGQLVSCFVAIEKNTRTTYELIKQQQS